MAGRIMPKKADAGRPINPAPAHGQKTGAAGFPIVGLGASAGGLEAFEHFFRGIPCDSGMAFVLVTHLDPDRASTLTEILQRSTAMPVLEAIKEFPTSCGQAAWDALPKIKVILDASRAAGIPVVFVKGNPMDKYFAGQATKGSLTWDDFFKKYDAPIHPMVEPLSSEYICQKSKASAFFGTPLASYLQRTGVDSVLITGCVTSGCVRSTAIDAWNSGFAPFVVEEGVFDRSRHSHLTSLFELNAKYATVVTLEEAKDSLAGFARRG